MLKLNKKKKKEFNGSQILSSFSYCFIRKLKNVYLFAKYGKQKKNSGLLSGFSLSRLFKITREGVVEGGIRGL